MAEKSQADQLAEPFDETLIYQRSLGGRQFDYVAVAEYIARLNKVLGTGGWNYEVLKCHVQPEYKEHVISHVRVVANVDGVTAIKEAYGGTKIKTLKGGGVMDLGNDLADYLFMKIKESNLLDRSSGTANAYNNLDLRKLIKNDSTLEEVSDIILSETGANIFNNDTEEAVFNTLMEVCNPAQILINPQSLIDNFKSIKISSADNGMTIVEFNLPQIKFQNNPITAIMESISDGIGIGGLNMAGSSLTISGGRVAAQVSKQ